ncbi:hypothetical protein AB833_03825 [Chromatiales bacterium (ex Bugula neritina AB1)]|nr:hypothetical protein AB833_03825 [Chromatiales bacterium (ex Bugula neritina AB1)]
MVTVFCLRTAAQVIPAVCLASTANSNSRVLFANRRAPLNSVKILLFFDGLLHFMLDNRINQVSGNQRWQQQQS